MSISLPSWTALASLPILLLPLGYLILLRPSQPASPLAAPAPRHGLSNKAGEDMALPSILAPAYTTHARLLPTPSKHAFSYPLLYIGVDVDALEAGELDLGYRRFKYGGVAGRLLGLRSRAYLTPDLTPSLGMGEEDKGQVEGSRRQVDKGTGRSLRQKVEDLLREYGLASEQVGRIWMLTMPSFLGFEGINPLTVWYIYQSDGSRELLAVILEVHNTFGEKGHAYVLPTCSSFTVPPKDGYSHAWTFPRGFHVSPFNSRDGYYTLDLLDPFLRPSPPLSSPNSSPSDPYPNFKVFLRLLTPSKQTKLHALLASSPSPTSPPIPLRRGHTLRILRTLARWPLALIATTPRILYQAYRLHYERRLAVYPRPEPGESQSQADHLATNSDDSHVGAGGVREESANEPNADWAQSGRAIGWQGAGGLETMARGVVERYLHLQFQHATRLATCRGLRVEFTYPSPPLHVERPMKGETAVSSIQPISIVTADPKFFTHLLLLPSPLIALTLFPDFGTRIALEDEADFTALFAASPASRSSLHHSPVLGRMMARQTADTRQSYLKHLFAHSSISPEPQHTYTLSAASYTTSPSFAPDIRTQLAHSANESLMSTSDQLRILMIVTIAAWADWAEEWIMNAIGARFVEGQEPWKIWERAMKRAYRQHEGHNRRDGLTQQDELEDWELARIHSGSSLTTKTESGVAVQSGRAEVEGEWVDLGSVRYA